MFAALRASLSDLSVEDLELYRVSMPHGIIDGTLSATTLKALNFTATSEWLSAHFSEQAVREEVGTKALKLVASRLPKGTVRDLMEQHAADENRHKKIFKRLSELYGGYGSQDEEIKKLRESESLAVINHPNFRFQNFIFDTHISEVNSLWIISFINDQVNNISSNPAAIKAISSLIADEERHVLYTARLFIHFIKRNQYDDLYIRRSSQHFFRGSS